MSAKYSPVQYSEYLQLGTLLNAQTPQSAKYGKAAHDETLFIIVHQVYELWFKQIITEVDSLIQVFNSTSVDESALGTVISRLERVTTIQKLLLDQVAVIETMTPLDFLDFRDMLVPASGFQSVQFRLLENKLGLHVSKRLPFNAIPYHSYVTESEKAQLLKSESEPSIFGLVQAWLERTPFLQTKDFDFWKVYRAAVTEMFKEERATISSHRLLKPDERERNLAEINALEKSFNTIFDPQEFAQAQARGEWRLSQQALQAALLISLYRDQPMFYLPFRLLTKLQDIDENFTAWRYRHAQMAHRMLGEKTGTGGSTGSRYLKAATEKHRIYTDFFNLATYFIPRSKLPELPASLRRNLGFAHGI